LEKSRQIFGARHQCGDRIDHEHVDSARLHQRFRNFERLFAVVRLRDEEILEADTELARVAGVERMFRVDKGADPAALLCLGDTFECEWGL
jgi:hypothetical protein